MDEDFALHMKCTNKRYMKDVTGVKISDFGWRKNTPLHVACEEGNITAVKELLMNSRVDVNAKNTDGQTPFYLACKKGRTEIVKMMLTQKRIDIDTITNKITTPLWISVNEGHKEVTDLLLMDGRPLETEVFNINDIIDLTFKYSVLDFLNKGVDEKRKKLIKRYEVIIERRVANTFAMVIMISHEYTTSKDPFFAFILKLPAELQMIVCNRMLGSTKQFVSSKLVTEELRILFASTK